MFHPLTSRHWHQPPPPLRHRRHGLCQSSNDIPRRLLAVCPVTGSLPEAEITLCHDLDSSSRPCHNNFPISTQNPITTSWGHYVERPASQATAASSNAPKCAQQRHYIIIEFNHRTACSVVQTHQRGLPSMPARQEEGILRRYSGLKV